MEEKNSNAILERLIYLGVATFFLWPIVFLYMAKALPVADKEISLKASFALQNLMEKALAGSHKPKTSASFVPLKGFESLGLEGKTNIVAHPEYKDLVIIKTSVKWLKGSVVKVLNLEQTASADSSSEVEGECEFQIKPDSSYKYLEDAEAIALELSNAVKININTGESSKECIFETVNETFGDTSITTEKNFSYANNCVDYKVKNKNNFETKQLGKNKSLLQDCQNVVFTRISPSLIELSYVLPEKDSNKTISKLIYLRNIK